MPKHSIKHSESDWQRVKQEATLDQPIVFDPKTDLYDPNNDQATNDFLNSATTVVRRPGRPKGAVQREALSMRMDPDLLAYLRASGKGWQSRLHQLIQEAVVKGEI